MSLAKDEMREIGFSMKEIESFSLNIGSDGWVKISPEVMAKLDQIIALLKNLEKQIASLGIGEW